MCSQTGLESGSWQCGVVVLEVVEERQEGCCGNALTENGVSAQMISGQLVQGTSLGRLDGNTFRRFKSKLPSANVIYLGVFLAILQAVDGLFTSIGVDRFGIAAEGNPLLRHLMLEYGHVPALASTKVMAIVVVAILTLSARNLPWIKNALGAVSCVYLFAAVVPWTYILFISPHI